jgi:hypothetical protein
MHNKPTSNTRSKTRKNDFALSVRIALLEAGLTQAEMARRLCVHPNSIRLAMLTDLCPRVRERMAAELGIAA